MDDEKIKQLFSSFNPIPDSDPQFISRLQHSLDAVEAVKAENAALRRRSRRAAVIAAAAGFIAGFLFSLALPHIASAVTSIQPTLPPAGALRFMTDNFMLVAWTIMGAASTFIAVNTYEVALSLMRSRNESCI